MARTIKPSDADALEAKIKIVSYSRDIHGMLGGWSRIHRAVSSAKERAHVLDFATVMFEEVHELGGHDMDRVKRILPLLRDAVAGKRDPAKTALECGEIVFNAKLADLKHDGIDVKFILG